MKTFIAALFLISCIASTGSAQTGTPSRESDPLAQELTAKSARVQTLRKTKDVAGLKSLLAPDFVEIGSAGRLHAISEFLDDAQDGALRDVSSYDLHVTPIDAQTTLVTYNMIASMVEGDDVISPRYLKVSDLWVKQGDDWRLKFEQATPLRPVD
jgi:hypothetical protein